MRLKNWQFGMGDSGLELPLLLAVLALAVVAVARAARSQQVVEPPYATLLIQRDSVTASLRLLVSNQSCALPDNFFVELLKGETGEVRLTLERILR